MFIISISNFPTHIAKTNNKTKSNKMIKVNNQAIYNSNLNRFSRNIVMKNLHNYLIKEIKPYKETFLRESYRPPFEIEITIFTVINHGSISMRDHKISWKYPTEDYIPNWDIENLATIWIKAICDSLVMLKIIPDDNISYINKISYKFKEVENLTDRKLVIKIK